MRYQQLLKNCFLYFFLFLFSLWVVGSFFPSGLPNTHDGQSHVMRLAAFHQAQVDGQIPPRWAGNLAYGFGSPVLSFAFPLPYLLGEIFHRFGFSFIDSLKAVFIFSVFFSALAMFLFLSRLTERLPAFLGATLYLLAPYRFIDLYVRGDVGESLVFIFPPFILWLLWDKERLDFRKIIFSAFAIGAMFLSHQIMAAVFTVIIFLLLVLRGRLIHFLITTALGVLLVSFNLFPLIFEKSLTNLSSLAQTNYQNQFPKFQSLLYSRWHWGPAAPDNPEVSMAFQLGVAQWLVFVLLAGFLLWRFFSVAKASDHMILRLSVLVSAIFLFFLFLITSPSEFLWHRLSLLQTILYPWRLLGAAVFLVALMGSLLIYLVKQNSIKIFLSIILVVLAWYGNRHHTQVVGRTIHDDAFYLTYPGTSDMWGEFLPKNTELPQKPPEGKVEVLSGKATVDNLKIKSNEILFKTESHGISSLRVNNFYYPGWQVWVDQQKTQLESSPYLEFSLGSGKHEVKAKFTETPIRQISNYLSLGTLVFLLFLGSQELVKRK